MVASSVGGLILFGACVVPGRFCHTLPQRLSSRAGARWRQMRRCMPQGWPALLHEHSWPAAQ